MRVWRVETKSGLGPYADGLGWENKQLENTQGSGVHPPGSSDCHLGGHGQSYKDVKFCVTSTAMLRHWFDGAWSFLACHGCRVVEYEVPNEHLYRGCYQAAFPHKVGLKIRSMAVRTFCRKQRKGEV
jgi:hypothetical protein